LTQDFRGKGLPLLTILVVSKTRINVLSCGIRIWAHLSFVLSQSTHLIDRRTDGQTDRQKERRTAFSWLDHVACSAVKSRSTILKHLQNSTSITYEKATSTVKRNSVFSIDYKLRATLTNIMDQQGTKVPHISGSTATLRSASRPLLHVPRTRTVYGSRAFSVAAPTLWNSLPADITNVASLTAFRNRLKTFLFHHTPSGCSAD